MNKLIILFTIFFLIQSCSNYTTISLDKSTPTNKIDSSKIEHPIFLDYIVTKSKTQNDNYFEKTNEYLNEYDSIISILNTKKTKLNSWIITHYPIDENNKTNIIKNTTYDFIHLSFNHKNNYQSDIFTIEKKLYRFKNKHSEGFGISRLDFIVKNLDNQDTLINQSNYCNKVDFEFRKPYYITKTYGCCSIPNILKKYNFNGNQVSETYSGFLNIIYKYQDNGLSEKYPKLIKQENQIQDKFLQIGLTFNNKNTKEYLITFLKTKGNSFSKQYVKIRFKETPTMFNDHYNDLPLIKYSINNSDFVKSSEIIINNKDDFRISIPSNQGEIIIPLKNGKPFGKNDQEIILSIQ